MQKISLKEKFTKFSDYWRPKIVGEINDAHIKLVKLKGEFSWHHHESEDELFLVIKGRLLMRLRTGDIIMDEGEFIIIPKGTEHCPASIDEEAHVLLMEPKTTLNTGNLVNERTVAEPEHI
ncbi:MAG TPA: cupin domain-containing protein [Gammaproteobacteria bacterium]|nr:cupin domain-containing protein [Gammaproteobacteria bacterium]